MAKNPGNKLPFKNMDGSKRQPSAQAVKKQAKSGRVKDAKTPALSPISVAKKLLKRIFPAGTDVTKGSDQGREVKVPLNVPVSPALSRDFDDQKHRAKLQDVRADKKTRRESQTPLNGTGKSEERLAKPVENVNFINEMPRGNLDYVQATPASLPALDDEAVDNPAPVSAPQFLPAEETLAATADVNDTAEPSAFVDAVDPSLSDGACYERREEGSFFSAVLFAFAGSENHSYEDAADFDAGTGRVAIADGTTLGGHSEIIAKAVVENFVWQLVDLSIEGERQEWWTAARKQWYIRFRDEFNNASSMEQVKWNRGGSSTFTGLQFKHDPEPVYRAFHIGDCSMLWFSEGNHCHTDGAHDHNAHPEVLHSENADAPPKWNVVEWNKFPGDMALLCSDALAKYFLAEQPWKTQDGFLHWLESQTAAGYQNWAAELRDTNKLDSDDYTLIILRFPLATGTAG